MNLNSNPTLQELRELIARCDDNEGDHLIWVGWDGSVNIQVLTQDLYDDRWIEQNEKRMKFKLGILIKSKDHVGLNASLDNDWMHSIFDTLLLNWNNDAKGNIQIY
jgi:hypothetical protein